MSLKEDSFKKLRKEKNKWHIETATDYEEREKELSQEIIRKKEPTINTSVRITAGKLKSLTIDVPPSTRPLTDRMKVRLFDILTRDIVKKSILDLYAGAGSFGLEALSRGAKHSTFVEISKRAIKVLENNIKKTGLTSDTELVKMKVEEYISKHKETDSFDIIFLDPPYKLYNTKNLYRMQDIIENSSQMLIGFKEPNKVFKGAYIVKHPKRYPIEKLNLSKVTLFETIEFGMNCISIYIVK